MAKANTNFCGICAQTAAQNQLFKSYIGLGYADCFTPSVILRNVLENPGWYTPYTPYQAEIAQGRLEGLLNFQTMVRDLTGMEVANASLLDEATAAAEAMTMLHRVAKSDALKFFVADTCFPQTIDVLRARAEPLGIELVFGDWRSAQLDRSFFGALVQTPDEAGMLHDLRDFIAEAKRAGVLVAVATDLLSLTLLTPPGEMGADVVLRKFAAIRRADGLRWPSRGVFRDAREARSPGARTHHRRFGRRARESRVSNGAANSRAAYPPGEGDVEHLHRAGAARQYGRTLRRVSRTERPDRHRAPRPRIREAPRTRARQGRRRAAKRIFLRHSAPGTTGRRGGEDQTRRARRGK